MLLIGIGWNLRQVLRLSPEVTWLETYQTARPRLSSLPSPQLLAPMASMLAAREAQSRTDQARFTLSASAMRSLLDGIASRLDESRELSRYMTGLLIFLGLLGTFWGLLKTVGAVSDVIGSMSVGSGDLNALFEQLKSGLAKPLAGMGTAFSASMFGLSGALVLGFLDLTAGQAQNRFFNELEEWLAGLTRLSSGALAEGDGSMPVYVQALLEQTAENMENLQRILQRGEDSRAQANQAVLALTEHIATLSDAMRTSQQLMLRIAEAQAAIGPAHAAARRAAPRCRASTTRRAAICATSNSTCSACSPMPRQGRAQSTAELRNDLRILTRTVAALAEDQRRSAMALTVRRRGDNGLTAWPGYVDALSTLLMVIIFVLLVFVLAQAFLSVALTGRDKQLDRVNRQLAEVSDMLSLERGRGADLQQSIAQLNRELAAASAARDSLSQQLAALQDAGGARHRRPRHAARGARPAGAAAGRCRAAGALRRRAGGAAAAGSRGVGQPHRCREAGDRDSCDAACRGATAAWRHHAPARRCAGAACRDAAADRRTRQDGAGEQGDHRGEAVRSRQAGGAEPRARRAARRAGEAGAGRGRARDDRPAAARRRRDAACRGEAARRFGAGADRAAQPAGGRTEGAAHRRSPRRSIWRRRRGRRRTRRSPISARS